MAEKQKEKLGRQCPGSWFDQPSNVEPEEKAHNVACVGRRIKGERGLVKEKKNGVVGVRRGTGKEEGAPAIRTPID